MSIRQNISIIIISYLGTVVGTYYPLFVFYFYFVSFFFSKETAFYGTCWFSHICLKPKLANIIFSNERSECRMKNVYKYKTNK